jgi:hypothetical protein
MNGFAASTKRIKPIKAGKLIAVFLTMFSLLGLFSTPAFAAGEERTIEVDFYSSSPPPACEGMESPADWGPDLDLSYEGVPAGGFPYSLETEIAQDVEVGLNLNWETGQDADCMPVDPKGDVYTSVVMTDPNVVVSQFCTTELRCPVDVTLLSVSAILDFTGLELGTYGGTFTVTWAPES